MKIKMYSHGIFRLNEMVAFSSRHDLQQKIIELPHEDFFEKFIRGQHTPHFSSSKLDFAAGVLAKEYGLTISRDELVVVGSSKLGFAMHDKYREGTLVAQAFRPYGEDSDIDLAICNPNLFSILWHEISAFAASQEQMPCQKFKKLGLYLIYGWLRLDHLPFTQNHKLLRCRKLNDCRAKIRKDREHGHPKIAMGIYYDLEHLKIYQTRSIRQCKERLENPL